jgi:hypothetical protein
MRTRLLNFRRIAPLLAIVPLLVVGTAQAADQSWGNTGLISVPPQIDAFSFFNSGTIDIYTEKAFETSSTRNFTNTGTMLGTPGWHFATIPSTIGVATPAETFINKDGGLIRSYDPPTLVYSGTFQNPVPRDGSYLWVEADHIVNVNNSRLSVGANGWLRLRGKDVNVNRGALEVMSIIPVGSFSIDETTFDPDAGIFDIYWGGTNIANPPGQNTSAIWNGTSASTPVHQITTPGSPIARSWAFGILPTHADSITVTNYGIRIWVTNLVGVPEPWEGTISNIAFTNIVAEEIFIPTNITRQAVFVSVSDPSVMGVDFGWFPSSDFTNVFYTPNIRISTISSNIVDASAELNQLYLYDTLASSPIRVLMANSASALNYETYRPTNYNLARMPMLGGLGAMGDGWPEATFLYEPGVFSNRVTAIDYSAYGAFVNNRATDAPIVPAGTVTNLPGRVQIYADSLDLRRARIRSEGEVILKTEHLVGSANADIDSEYLGFFLSSTNETLRVVNLAKEQVARTRGDLFIWSGVWNNDAVYYITNWIVTTNLDTNNVAVDINVTRADYTNDVIYNLYALLVSGDNLGATFPVVVWDMVNHADNLIVDDRMSLVQNFELDATNFTLNGSITFSNASLTSWIGTSYFVSLPDWVYTNSPNLMRFTNNGTLTVPNTVHFGDDRPNPAHPTENLPLDAWVNRGTLNTSSLEVDSGFFQNSGSLLVNGPMSIVGGTGSLEGGASSSAQSRFAFTNLRLKDYALSATILDLEVTGTLADAGVGASSSVTVTRGFNLWTKPQMGDLLGSTFRTVLPNFAQTDHTWAGEDRGASAAGYMNNAAIGSLVIEPAASPALDPLGYFKGSAPGKALYVDYLDLGALGQQWSTYLEIDPSLTIYYATARLGFTPPTLPNGIVQTPEEYLNGKLDGRLQWVQDYSGGLSSVAVLVDGATRYMNSALRNSRVIDSDNDGTPNYFDSTPLGGSTSLAGASEGVTLKPAWVNPNLINDTKAFAMSWLAAPNTVYQIEVATDLSLADWKPLTLYTNKLSTAQPASFMDTKSSAIKQRFYRIRAK